MDCNKDGEADIIAYNLDSSYQDTNVYVRIIDPDAVTASATGKSYSTPITVTVIGRDGISKDALKVKNVNIK